ncbi:MAG: hypothetical protein K6G18_02050 [Treponema sp.]|nr:hypothetical protein [Treponema sp.]
MSYEAIAKEAASLTFAEQLKLIALLANLMNASEGKKETAAPVKTDYRDTYPKGFFELFGSIDDPTFKEPEDIPLELDDQEFSKVKGLKIEDWTK